MASQRLIRQTMTGIQTAPLGDLVEKNAVWRLGDSEKVVDLSGEARQEAWEASPGPPGSALALFTLTSVWVVLAQEKCECKNLISKL